MKDLQPKLTNRVLVVDDDVMLIGEYVRCLGEDFEPDSATTTGPSMSAKRSSAIIPLDGSTPRGP